MTMTTITHHKIGSDLYLIRQSVMATKGKAKPVAPPAHHILVIDCSGSMSYDLPKIREQLKKKLPKLLQEKDLISMVWFSGRGQHGVLFEAEPVPTLADLKIVNNAIDRWLKPIGLTGFKEPLEDAADLVARVAKKNPSHATSLLFMSDGCDNQWDRGQVIAAVEKVIQAGIASTTVIEYGYYADRPFLTKMAERAGGSLIFAEDFDRYDPIFDSTVSKRAQASKRIQVELTNGRNEPIDTSPIGGFAFALHDGDLLTFGVEDPNHKVPTPTISVPEGVDTIAYLSTTAIGDPGLLESLDDLAKHEFGLCEYAAKQNQKQTGYTASDGTPTVVSLAYAALSLFATRMKPEIVFPILKGLGDVWYIEEFANCFGKQRYSAFQDYAKSAAFDAKWRFPHGRDASRVPPEDAFTIIDLLQILQEDEGNRVLLDHPEFKYSRISRGRKDADPDALEFSATPSKDGYPISSLVWNEDRPNVSFMVRKEGTVDISKKIKDANATVPAKSIAKLPTKFPTWIFRNYAVVKDGLVNIEVLPVKLTEATVKKLTEIGKAHGRDFAFACIALPSLPSHQKPKTQPTPTCVDDSYIPGACLIDLKSIPIVNRRMVKTASAKKLFEDTYALTNRRAAQKVYNSYYKEKFEKKSEGYKVLYGEETAAWLKEIGLTDYNGFSPKRVQAEATDVYIGKELSVHLKGLSSLPSLKEVNDKRSKAATTAAHKATTPKTPKMTPSAALMVPYIEEVEEFLKSSVYTKAKDKDAVYEAWLKSEQKTATRDTRTLLGEIARAKFAIVVGQVWFTEFDSINQNTMTIHVGGPNGSSGPGPNVSNGSNGSDLECRVEMKEVEIPI